MRKSIVLLIMMLVMPLFGGCAVALLGGAAAGGVMLAEDRRTVGTVTEDKGIELKAGSRIGERVPAAHVNTTSYNKLVLLTGEAPNAAAKEDVERVARGVENVRGVFNEMQVGAVSAISARTNDAYITSKVKARFVDANKFNALHVKVVTEASVVYLLGLVRRAEADAATDVARTTGGVVKVVRLFEYLD
jgi:osmotically-inducible protein OsmY